ncbi:hypothetical protein Taro_027956 [Colocasia esculenta]|uniref:Pentatricopeptide repeat-containing protein n=1 Tax=Colocasia esculenta TaxID=4460 RepID=A0A843VH73_COLES|nr:hypothetical protein [Colocasia esculenta]
MFLGTIRRPDKAAAHRQLRFRVSIMVFAVVAVNRVTPPVLYHRTDEKLHTLRRLHAFAETLCSLLERCSSMRELKRLHARVVTGGLVGDAFLVGKIIAFCAVSAAGDIGYAQAVFDRAPNRNRFMWNSLIRGFTISRYPRKALSLHRQMLGSGLLPNEFSLPFVLKCCASELAFEEMLLIHALVFKLGYAAQVFVQNSLLNSFMACGSTGLAQRLFNEMPQKSVVSWNSMIDGYCQSGNMDAAFCLFRDMMHSGLEPDKFTLVSLLSICSQTRYLKLGRLMHHRIQVSGVDSDVILGNALLDMYAKCGDLSSAHICFNHMPERDVITWTTMVSALANNRQVELSRSWFDQMPERNVVSWNAMISCYVQCGQCHEALDVYRQMQSFNVEPDEATLTSVLSACSQLGDLITGKKIHEYVCLRSPTPSITLCNSLVDMYAKCGLVDMALDFFNTMPRKDVVSWNVIIGALAIHGRAMEAINIFREMIAEGIHPDGFTFVGLLSACSHGGFLEVGQNLFKAMSDVYRVPLEIEHYACMVDLLGRGGQLLAAVELINSMPVRPDIVIWGALLGGCRIHGNLKIIKQVLKQVLESASDSGGLYVLLSNAYGEACKREDMQKVRKLMEQRGITKDWATSSLEINGQLYEFMVDNKITGDIYFFLDCLTDHMKSNSFLAKKSFSGYHQLPDFHADWCCWNLGELNLVLCRGYQSDLRELFECSLIIEAYLEYIHALGVKLDQGELKSLLIEALDSPTLHVDAVRIKGRDKVWSHAVLMLLQPGMVDKLQGGPLLILPTPYWPPSPVFSSSHASTPSKKSGKGRPNNLD